MHAYKCCKKIKYVQSEWFTAVPTLLVFYSVLLYKLTAFQLVKKFLTFYGTRKFIPYPEPAVSSPYPHIPLPEDPS